MPIALLLLLERIAMSPTVQAEAWEILKPVLASGIPPTPAQLTAANSAVDEAHSKLMLR